LLCANRYDRLWLMSFDVSAASGWVRLRFLQTELLNHTRSAHEASGSA
jgi:hypothetical protein